MGGRYPSQIDLWGYKNVSYHLAPNQSTGIRWKKIYIFRNWPVGYPSRRNETQGPYGSNPERHTQQKFML